MLFANITLNESIAVSVSGCIVLFFNYSAFATRAGINASDYVPAFLFAEQMHRLIILNFYTLQIFLLWFTANSNQK